MDMPVYSDTLGSLSITAMSIFEYKERERGKILTKLTRSVASCGKNYPGSGHAIADLDQALTWLVCKTGLIAIFFMFNCTIYATNALIVPLKYMVVFDSFFSMPV